MTDFKDQPEERHVLPDRRLAENRRIDTPDGHKVFLSIGYDPKEISRPREVFYSAGFKSGSALEFQLQDACILISMLLQHGLQPDAVAKSLARTDQPNGDTAYASMTGLIVDEISKPPSWAEQTEKG